MNTKRDGAPSQDTSSFALPVVSDRPAAAADAVGEALEHAAANAVSTEPGYGRSYWRSLEEKLGASEYMEETRPEFPVGADLPPSGVARREFMQLLGASLALAGATACSTRPQDERILPYTKTPPEVSPGNPLHYASGMTLAGHTSGLLITAREGRPIKIEGNPQHPVNQGAAGPWEQAFLLSLYDPSRARVLRQGKSPRALRVLAEDISTLVGKAAAADGGARLRFLGEPTNSPLMGDLRNRVLKKLPNARFYSYTAMTQDAESEAARALFGGQAVSAVYDFSKADVILSLDADFLESRPANLAYARQFADRRDPKNGPLNRLYVAEARYSITGGMADHRLRVKSSEVLAVAAAVAQAVGGPAASLAGAAAGKAQLRGDLNAWVQAVVGDLRTAGARAVVVAGERQPAAVHALAHAINAALGAAGSTVRYVQAPIAEPTGLSQVRALVEDIKAGRVDTLVITTWNPVYSLPADAGLAELLDPAKNPNRAKMSVLYTGLYEDETSQFVDWFVPAAHPLETWSDGRAVDGTVAIAQPLIQPLFNGVPESELLALFLDEPFRPAYQLLREYWQGQAQATAGAPADFESRWEVWVSEGIIAGTASPAATATPDFGAASALVTGYTPPAAGELELNFVHDYKVFDGRFANNAWLQELPDLITKMVWDNAALVSPQTATDNNLEPGSLAELSYGGQTLTVPVWVTPGLADGTVTVALGYGRSGLHESVAKGVGFNANVLRRSAAPWFDGGAKLTQARGSHKFSLTQTHWRMEGRPVALDMPIAELQKPSVATQHVLHRVQGELKPTIHDNLPDFDYSNGYKWGMAIDLSRCTGCSACVVACQAENNIPVVGKEQVARSREMQWLRIDRYFEGPENDPKMVMQPVMCVHCEKAPCEYVCPVNATVHSDEGLNDMVYNRCVGTRYCSNNCPYKVRRFNYLHYTADKTSTEKMLMNPDVTVRNRGVMEKCTYCVQRIERVRINARVEKRLIQEKELMTACQQTCPTQAIVFGSLNDKQQRVTQLHEDERAYKLLHELGTRPRTAHLIRVRNPNPALEPAKSAAATEGSH
ncbi:TAT-variant-translocated molybdopterin oxidoreductase [Pyxidicoccus fallax]|uniref:TAT-variant-translocated molybdopterin oxidoreductase n=1 Tax=Pyxidicoccus fallax TaxID=394095 RepID=A0A848L8K4_9BACT|nr:TAT-variant-translocated molybdopterin oxidoreductase [Pyxidicoccus fallax]NMO15330.1 TAT-variant-translocated molybdopterin oxidoreductase [Pyxidicoccus fallax]NPC77250.1 TAT-variant-translocated molybdopterin oxidoreductase [Pyxidicoccus fallax]